MADTKKIGAKIVLDGEKEFNQSLRNSKTALKEFDSELKLSQTQFKNNSKSLEALQKVQQAYAKQQEQLQKQEKTYVDQLAKASKAYDEAKSSHESTAKSVENLKNKLNEAEREYGENSEEVQKLNKELKESEDQYKKEESAIAGLEGKMSKWQTGLNETRTALVNVESDLNSVTNDIDHFGEEVEDAGDATAKANPEMDQLGVSMGKLVSAELIASGIKKLAGAVVELAEASFDVGIQFESSMSQVAATMGITTEEIANGSAEFNALSDAAKQMGETTMFSASQSADALNYLALAGYDAQKAIEVLPKVLDLAAAGGMDLAYASDLVTDAMSALGMETSDLDNYIDQMARSAQKSNTSVSQLGEATLVTAGAVAQVHMPLDAMNTALGILANNGLKGAEGGTKLRNIILSLTAPTKKAAAQMKDLGIDVADSNGDMRDLQDILEDLNAELGSMGDVERASTLRRIFNKTDIGAVNALLQSTNGEFSTLREKINDCDGAASEMAKTMNDNLKGKITILQSALEGLGIAAYEVFDEDAKKAVDGATDAVGRLTDSVKNGDLNVSLSKMADSFDRLIEGTVEWVEENLPKMIDGFTNIVDSADTIIPLVEGIVTGLLAFKTASSAVAMVEAVMQLFSASTAAAASAQEGLNLAVSANPYIILASVLAGVVVTSINLADAMYDVENGISAVDKASSDLAKTSETFNDKLSKTAQTRAENLASLEAEQDVTRELVDKLIRLQEEYSHGANNMALMKEVVDQLNVAVPDLNLSINEQNGMLNQNTEELKANVEQLMKRQLVEAAEKDLIEIAEQQYHAKKQLAELEKQKAEQDEELAKAEERLNEVTSDSVEIFESNGQALTDAQYAAISAREKNEELANQIDATKESISNLSEEYKTATDFINENKESTQADAEAIEEVGDQAKYTAGELRVMSDEFAEATSDLFDAVQKTLESSNDIFSKTKDTEKQNIDQMKQNVEDHVKQIEDWKDSYTELAGRVDTESGAILQYLAGMGVEGKGYIDEMLTLSDEDLNKFVEQMEDALTLPEEVALDVIDSYTTAVQESIDGMRDVAKKASTDGSELRKAEKDVAEALGKEMDEAMGPNGENIKAPVENAMKGVEGSLENAKPKVANESRDIAKAINEPVAKGVNYDTFKRYGEDAGRGLEQGLRSQKDAVAQAAQELADSANKAVSGPKGLDEHSPSKKMREFGRLGGEGLLEGFEDSIPDVVSAINKSMPSKDNIEVSSFQNVSINANAEGNGTLARIDELLTEYLPVLSQMKIVLDTGATVGALAPGMNSALGRISAREGTR